MKLNNIHIIGILEGGKKEQGIENLLEKVMTENFPNLVREKVMQVQETQKVPIKLYPEWSTPRHRIIKRAKFKDKEIILKAAREKEPVTFRGALIRLSTDFATETLHARREWQEVFQVMKSKGLELRQLYPERLS